MSSIESAAKLISDVISPFTFQAIILALVLLNAESGVLYFLVGVLFACVIPFWFHYYYQGVKQVVHRTMPLSDKVKRERSFIVYAISHLVGLMALSLMGAPSIAVSILLAIFGGSVVMAFVTWAWNWKISMHGFSVATLLVALVMSGADYGLTFLLVTIVWLSRLSLEAHDLKQLVAGTLVGLIATYLQLAFYLAIL